MTTNTSTARSVGDVTRLSWTVRSTGGTATNSDVTLVWATPSGAVHRIVSTSTASYSGSFSSTAVNHLATGSYYADVLSTEAGDYLWSFRSTGLITSSTDGRWAVRPASAST